MYQCPMCRKHNKHNLCSKSWCDCKHQQEAKTPGAKSESVHTVSAGLPTLGKGHK